MAEPVHPPPPVPPPQAAAQDGAKEDRSKFKPQPQPQVGWNGDMNNPPIDPETGEVKDPRKAVARNPDGSRRVAGEQNGNPPGGHPRDPRTMANNPEISPPPIPPMPGATPEAIKHGDHSHDLSDSQKERYGMPVGKSARTQGDEHDSPDAATKQCVTDKSGEKSHEKSGDRFDVTDTQPGHKRR